MRPSGAASSTARLRIEPLQAAHAPLLFPVLADPGLYLYADGAALANVEATLRRFETLERGPPPGTHEVWLNWVLLRRTDGAAVGTLQATVVPGSHAWIGYMLAPAHWGQGYATEAGAWLVAELRSQWLLRDLRASVDVRNTRSIAVLERLGFARVATETALLHGEATRDHHYRLDADG